MYMLFFSKTLLKLTNFFYCIREVQFWRQKYTVTGLIEPRVNILKTEVFPIEEQEPFQLLDGGGGFVEDVIKSFTKRLFPFSSPPHSFASILQCYAYQLSSVVVRKYKGISIFQCLFLLTWCAMLSAVRLKVAMRCSWALRGLCHPWSCRRFCGASDKWQESVHLPALRQALLGARGKQKVTISEHRKEMVTAIGMLVFEFKGLAFQSW